MVKKMRLIPSLFKSNKGEEQPWQWASCKQPKTMSFRGHQDMFKNVLFDGIKSPDDSLFTNSSECASHSTEYSEECDGESLEVVVRGVQSERLFFEPGFTSSILEEAKKSNNGFPFKESVAMAMESEDPYGDFRRSMEEMVQCHGLKDWDCLEELLGWYLKVNGKNNHGFIVGAFVDLLLALASPNSCSHSTSFSSAVSSLSSSSSPSLHSLQDKNEIDV